MRVYPNDLLLTYSSAKTRFPNKVTLTGTGGEDFDILLGGHNSSHRRVIQMGKSSTVSDPPY